MNLAKLDKYPDAIAHKVLCLALRISVGECRMSASHKQSSRELILGDEGFEKRVSTHQIVAIVEDCENVCCQNFFFNFAIGAQLPFDAVNALDNLLK